MPGVLAGLFFLKCKSVCVSGVLNMCVCVSVSNVHVSEVF